MFRFRFYAQLKNREIVKIEMEDKPEYATKRYYIIDENNNRIKKIKREDFICIL